MPESTGGTLYTYKISSGLEDYIYNYQIYKTLNNTIYRRLCTTNKTWGAWLKVSSSVQLNNDIGVNFNQGISLFKEGITINNLSGANGGLSPSLTAGVLITYRISSTSTSPYNYQEFT